MVKLSADTIPSTFFTRGQVGRHAFVNFHNPDPIDLKMVREGWEEAKKIILEDTADLLILDELSIVLATGMLPLEEVIDFLKKYKGKTEIITTGRGAPEELDLYSRFGYGYAGNKTLFP